MKLEREDWEEPVCCFRSGAGEDPGAGADGGGASIREVIGCFDRLISRDAGEEAAAFLEKWLEVFGKDENWSSQITILNEMMGFYRNSGERDKGMKAVEEGLKLIKEHRLSDTVSGATTCINAATTMKAFGKTREAMAYYEQAFRVYGQALSPEDYRFGGLFNNMALAYEDLGEFERAEVYYKKAMDIMERLRPGSILEIAVTWVNLAVLYEKDGFEDRIWDCLEQAIVCFRSEEVPHDAYYAFNCRKCAGTFGHFGYFRMNQELTREADRIYAEAAGTANNNERTGGGEMNNGRMAIGRADNG